MCLSQCDDPRCHLEALLAHAGLFEQQRTAQSPAEARSGAYSWDEHTLGSCQDGTHYISVRSPWQVAPWISERLPQHWPAVSILFQACLL